MRRSCIVVFILLCCGIFMISCEPSSVVEDSDVSLDAADEDVSASKASGTGSVRVLERIERTVIDGDEEKTESYDIEYAEDEFRTSVVFRDAVGKVHRADAFFNIDGSLSFVRMRDAGGSTKTVHFVYDSVGNPIERIESLNDAPLEKVEYFYDAGSQKRRDLKVSEWKEGRWMQMEGRKIALYLNADELPVAIESRSPEGNRRVTFEYLQDGVAIDHYVDSTVDADGAESSASCFVNYRAGRPEAMTVRSDERPGFEFRIVAEFDDAGEAAELIRDCSSEGCAEIERRAFTYGMRESEPLMPPVSIVMPFLGLGSSLLFMEEPEVLLGKEGIGLPSWIGL